MIAMIVVLAAVSVWIEIKLLRRIKVLRSVNQKSPLAGLGMSLGISALLGAVFGAAGVIVLIAGLLSTAAAEPFRRFSGARKSALDAKVESLRTWLVATRDTYRPVGIFFKYFFLILFMPIWLPVHRRRKKMLQQEFVEVDSHAA